MTATATYIKLRDGSWGLRIAAYWPRSVHAGLAGTEQVTVRRKDGTETIEIVGRVLTSYKDACVTIATIARDEMRAAQRAGYRSGSARYYGRDDYYSDAPITHRGKNGTVWREY